MTPSDKMTPSTEKMNLDENNGQNWYVLGNAYLTLFVHSSGVMKQELIKKSYSSYERAEKLGQNFNPDLHYNRAQEGLSNISITNYRVALNGPLIGCPKIWKLLG